jgi:hypothetical protein
MRPMTLSIQFCGGCNPRIDRGRIALELQQALEGMGHRVIFNSIDADLVIFLSGCMSGCAFKFNPKDPPYVAVAATTVDNVEVGEAGIVPEVIRKVRDCYERMETEVRKEDHECSGCTQTG